MSTAIYSLVASNMAQEKSIEILANNLANASTPGFKADRPVFRSFIEQALLPGPRPDAAAAGAARLQTPTVLFDSVRVDFAQGPLQRTDNQLDMAIEGDGFFVIQTPQGLRYTRQGNFTLGADGRLLTTSNLPVMGARGPVVARGGKLEVTSDGRLRVDGNEIDRLMIANFPRPYRLTKDETGLLAPPGGQGAIEPGASGVAIKQGYIELSNVNPIKELVRLIAASRAIESYQKSIQRLLGDQGILSRSATTIGRLT